MKLSKEKRREIREQRDLTRRAFASERFEPKWLEMVDDLFSHITALEAELEEALHDLTLVSHAHGEASVEIKRLTAALAATEEGK